MRPNAASTSAAALARTRQQQQHLQLQQLQQLRASSSLPYKKLAAAVPTALLLAAAGGGTGLGAGVAACFEVKKRRKNVGDNETFFRRGGACVPPRAARAAASSALSRLGLTPLAASLSRLLAALAEEAATCGRALFLALLFAPALATLPLARALSKITKRNGGGGGGDSSSSSSSVLEAWSSLLASTLAAAGPAFIKWGQWAATRGDLFPPHVCRALRRLQSDAPRHPPEASVAAIEAAFGGPLSSVFETFEKDPVASGSVAQVHRATLSEAAARAAGATPGAVVAVKVRHPGAAALMSRDFELMRRAAALCAALPRALGGGAWGVSLQESVRQFGAPLREQLDLAIEVRGKEIFRVFFFFRAARGNQPLSHSTHSFFPLFRNTLKAAHLARFNRNFRRWRNVSFPRPLEPLVTPGVLVESFESGVPISEYVYGKEGGQDSSSSSSSSSSSPSAAAADKRRNAVAASLGRLGLGCYLQMLLRDNFVVRRDGKRERRGEKRETRVPRVFFFISRFH